MLIRSAERFRSEHNGIVSLHCFSAGAFHDPERMGVDALVAVDEHLLAPGAGFAEHAHRGVDIVSLVVSGTLRHVGATSLDVTPEHLLVQVCGDGVRHAEANASTQEPLQLLQMTLLGDAAPGGSGAAGARLASPPIDLARGSLRLLTSGSHRVVPPCFVYVITGSAEVDDVELAAGDSVAPDAPAVLTARGQVVLWRLGGD